jgi:hypothetical protein
VLLNDWNSSVEIGTDISYSSIYFTSPDRLLGVSQKKVPAIPYHDLYAVVCCLFYFVHPHIFRSIQLISNHDDIRKSWEYWLSSTFWLQCINAAKQHDYDALKTYIQHIMQVT